MAYRSIQARLGLMQPCYYHPCFNIKAATERAKLWILHDSDFLLLAFLAKFSNFCCDHSAEYKTWLGS